MRGELPSRVVIFHPLEGLNVRRITQFSLYTLGTVKQLAMVQADDPPDRFFSPLLFVSVILQSFLGDSQNSESLPSSARAAQSLMEHIDNLIIQPHRAEPLESLTQPWVQTLNSLEQTFETLLADELARLPTYVVEPCGIFSSNALIQEAERHFPESVRTRLPEQVAREFQESGKCLAFDAFTASGFHAFRALEYVARRYHMVLHGLDSPEDIELGPLNNGLRKFLAAERAGGKPDAELADLELIVITLDRTRAILRNPLMHPELFLDKDQAMEVFDITKNVISWMVRDADRRDNGKI